MLILRKIVLQFGAIFLLVSLKMHGGRARSVSRSGEQLQRPDLLSRSQDEFLKLTINNEDVSSPVPNNVLHREDTSTEPTDVYYSSGDSVKDLYVIENHSNFTDGTKSESAFNRSEVLVNGINESNAVDIKQTDKSFGANSSIISNAQAEKMAGNAPLMKPTNSDLNTEETIDDRLEEKSFNISEFLLSIKNKSANASDDANTESKRESLLEAGRKAIRNLGSDLKKLKKNVDTFRENLRKLLFESDVPPKGNTSAPKNASSGVSHQTDKMKPDNRSVMTMSQNGSSVISKKVVDEASMGKNASVSKKLHHFRISAAASDMGEASRRMGEFLQKQYWDSKGNTEQNEQDAMISRGK